MDDDDCEGTTTTTSTTMPTVVPPTTPEELELAAIGAECFNDIPYLKYAIDYPPGQIGDDHVPQSRRRRHRL